MSSELYLPVLQSSFLGYGKSQLYFFFFFLKQLYIGNFSQ